MNRLFAIGDVHGCFATLYELIVRRLRLGKTDKLVMLGDYIDRGSESREIIELIIDLQSRGYNIVPLMGNHEAMLLDAVSDPLNIPLWMMNSGLSTLLSFGITDVSELDEKYISLFRSMKYYEQEGNFLFVHAGFNDEAEDPFSDQHCMIWECRPAYNNPKLSGMVIVHGHRPKTAGFVRNQVMSGSRVIPVDTGCIYEKELGYGILTAIELNTMELTHVERI